MAGVLKIRIAGVDTEVPIVSDHGQLSGLGDNDHPQYALAVHAVRHTDGSDDIRDATTALKGIAKFINRDFLVAAGGVSLGLLDSDSSHRLFLLAAENLTAARSLSFVTGDADRTLTFSGNPTLADWFDQPVKAASSVTFAAVTTATISDPADAGVAVDGVLMHNSQIELGTDKVIQFSSNDQKIYASSATRLNINAKTSLKFNINSVEEASLAAGGLTVTNTCNAQSLRATGDAGGFASARTITNVTLSGLSGAAATLPNVGVPKEGGPQVAAAWGWKKEFTGINVDWAPVWR